MGAGWVAALFNAHNPALVGYLTARLRSPEEAKEVAQEAYVRLLQLGDPCASSLLRAYLFKTAANLPIDRLRRRNQLQRTERAGASAQICAEICFSIAVWSTVFRREWSKS
jgi:RNA polymerase sigma-70 factor (ECF subfamily)